MVSSSGMEADLPLPEVCQDGRKSEEVSLIWK